MNFLYDMDQKDLQEYDNAQLYSDKSVNFGMTMSGSCDFFVNCGNSTKVDMDKRNVSSSRWRTCCSDGWIGATYRAIWDPHGSDNAWWIGTPGIFGFTALLRLSMLVAMWSSLTSWLSGMVQLAAAAGLDVMATYPATTFTTCSLIFLVFCAWMMHERKVDLKSRSHLGPGQVKRRWRGNLQQRWNSKVKLKGLIFLMLYVEAAGMDAQQANDLLTRIMELSNAAAQAATTATSMIEGFQTGGKGSSRFGDGAKVLRAPDVFEMDDPVRYSLWREQFLNWFGLV